MFDYSLFLAIGFLIVAVIAFALLNLGARFAQIESNLKVLEHEIEEQKTSSNTLKNLLEEIDPRHRERHVKAAQAIRSILDSSCRCDRQYTCTPCQIEESAYYGIRQAYEEGIEIGRSVEAKNA
jgi:alcohol dehydrogenase class IV